MLKLLRIFFSKYLVSPIWSLETTAATTINKNMCILTFHPTTFATIQDTSLSHHNHKHPQQASGVASAHTQWNVKRGRTIHRFTHQLSLPSSALRKISTAVKRMESMIPATVNVPPTMAHTCNTKYGTVTLWCLMIYKVSTISDRKLNSILRT